MTLIEFVSILLAGIIGNNMIASSAYGADLAMNRTNTLKVTSVFALVISVVVIISSTTTFLLKPLYLKYGIGDGSILITFFIIAVIVQVSEMVLERVAPKSLSEFENFIPLLSCSCAILAINIEVFVGFTNYAQVILNALMYSAGIFLSLILLSGLNHSIKFKKTPYGYERIVVSLLLLLLLSLIFTAF